MPPRRTNSLVRGSGHSMHGTRPQRGSIVKGKKGDTKGQTAVYDAILLSDISEDAFITNLTTLLDNDIMYSYIGNVVVAMNPFKSMPIYDQKHIDDYRDRSSFDPKLAPHIYALADNVFNDMRFRGRDQVVIISGESGAGKTESAKKILQYVAAVSGSTDRVTEVKNKLLDTNPVLEAFGNAKTTRNDNSSRFGKYMDIQFDYAGDPAGGRITTYLLEKARVAYQGEGERNFHIFYQILSGQASSLGIDSSPKKYKYLSGGAERAAGINDAQWYKEMHEGLHTFATANQQKHIYQILGAVLLLGNVTFKEAGNGDAMPDLPKKLGKLLGQDDTSIIEALTHNTRVARGDRVSTKLTTEQANNARDSLAKSMYQRLFAWVAKTINTSIAADDAGVKAVIGVLDIYGFEIMTVNSFEQFCINYCNEKLQQLFIELTLKTEQEEYVAEGIEWTSIDYFNNKVICDMVDGRGGIVALLDEESIRPGNPTDAQWLEKMRTQLKHKHFETRAGPQDKSLPEGVFRIVHYAGDVDYVASGFLEKNADTLYKDLSRLMYKSSNAILHDCFPEGDEATWAGAAKRPPTAGKSFVKSMKEMIGILQTKIPSYVRCIKPNQAKQPMFAQIDVVRHQVKYLGLVENVRVRRAGFCFRESYAEFFQRYKILSPTCFPTCRLSDKDGCKQIMTDLAIGGKRYQMGKTKLFIKNPGDVFRLEDERDAKLDSIVRVIQRWFRHAKAKKVIPDLATTLLGGGKKDGFTPSRMMLAGTYVEDRAALTQFQESGGAGFTTFAATVTKISTKGKPAPRVLAVAADAIYKVDTKYKLTPKRKLPFAAIAAIETSSGSDSWAIIKGAGSTKDTLVDFGGLGKLGEFCCRLTVASKAATGNAIPINVVEKPTWNGVNLQYEKGTGPKGASFAKPATVYVG